jgi:hypothetical protein
MAATTSPQETARRAPQVRVQPQLGGVVSTAATSRDTALALWQG